MRFVGQVIEHLTDNCLSVWDLDAERGWYAYGITVSQWPPAALAICDLSADGRYVETMTPPDSDTQDAYKDKKLI